MMALPEMVRREALLLLFDFCHSRVPDGVKDQYHLAFRIRENAATVYECFGPSRFSKADRKPAAQFRYDPERQVWALYWADRSLRWRLYDNAKPTAELADLIMEVHVDPAGVFFE
jgi:hypothetical protein